MTSGNRRGGLGGLARSLILGSAVAFGASNMQGCANLNGAQTAGLFLGGIGAAGGNPRSGAVLNALGGGLMSAGNAQANGQKVYVYNGGQIAPIQDEDSPSWSGAPDYYIEGVVTNQGYSARTRGVLMIYPEGVQFVERKRDGFWVSIPYSDISQSVYSPSTWLRSPVLEIKTFSGLDIGFWKGNDDAVISQANRMVNERRRRFVNGN